MPNFETPSPGVVADAVEIEVAELYRLGVTRAQAVDSLHTIANDLIQHLITPTPGPAQRSALVCADALRATATLLADPDDAPNSWAPTELQHDHPANTASAEYPTAATMPTPSTDTPPSPAPQYPPGLDVSKYVREPLAPQHPGRT